MLSEKILEAERNAQTKRKLVYFRDYDKYIVLSKSFFASGLQTFDTTLLHISSFWSEGHVGVEKTEEE